jgi:hypothetical protein
MWCSWEEEKKGGHLEEGVMVRDWLAFCAQEEQGFVIVLPCLLESHLEEEVVD